MIERDTKLPARRSEQKSRSFRLSESMRLIGVLFLLVLFAACTGGSGSGGFDISPSAENEIITQVLTARQCDVTETLTICPANEEALDVPGPGQTPAPEEIEVSTDVDPAAFTRCAESDGPTCTFAVQVTVDGLPAAAAYQLAARGFEPLSSWTIADAAVVPSAVGPTTFTAAVEIPVASTRVQIAVLVFSEAAGTATGEVRTLTETGASFAFVADPMAASG